MAYKRLMFIWNLILVIKSNRLSDFNGPQSTLGMDCRFISQSHILYASLFALDLQKVVFSCGWERVVTCRKEVNH